MSSINTWDLVNHLDDEIQRIVDLAVGALDTHDYEQFQWILGQLKAVDGGIRTSDADDAD